MKADCLQYTASILSCIVIMERVLLHISDVLQVQIFFYRWGRRRKKLLDDLKDRRGYCQLKEEALDRTIWRNRFGRGFGPIVWQITDDDEALFIFAMERYDPHQNRWSPVSPMSMRPKHLGCALFDNFIYAVGGRDDCMELSSAERYNPHSHTWNPIVAMTSCWSGVWNL